MRTDGAIVAKGLVFPEGPVWVDGDVVVTEILGGTVARVGLDGTVTRVATTGGGPNGATVDGAGRIWVTQNGGVDDDHRVPAAILRIDPATGAVDTVATEVGGIALEGPNDLAFGPDGRLWFTDPGGFADPAVYDKVGRIFVLDPATGTGELVAELGRVFPNGIGFLADGRLVWSETFSRRIMVGRPVSGRDGAGDVTTGAEVVIELPDRHHPDGFCVGADDTLYVASTLARCVSVVVGGELVERLPCGDGSLPTNCCFGPGDGDRGDGDRGAADLAAADLYVTESGHGTVVRFPLGVPGLPLHPGPAT